MAIPKDINATTQTVQSPSQTSSPAAVPTYQYGRDFKLLVISDLFVTVNPGQTLDLSDFRVKFSIKRTNMQTPNVADIKIYNLSLATALQIQRQFTRVVLQAGYVGQTGVIFAGNIKQIIIGRESGTETFVQLLASDGDLAYNFAIVSTSIPDGTTLQNDINSCIAAMTKLGTSAGGNSTVVNTQKRARGKVLHGNAKNYLRNAAVSLGYNWSIQSEKVVFIPITGYLPGQALVLNETNGMIGSPQQTLQGVNVKCLLNPNIQIGTKVQLNNQQVQQLAINLQTPGTPEGIPAPLTTDGIYFVAVAEFTGDTRGVEWYSSLIMYYIDPSLPIDSAVQVGYD